MGSIQWNEDPAGVSDAFQKQEFVLSQKSSEQLSVGWISASSDC
jgi:hypothetical protein